MIVEQKGRLVNGDKMQRERERERERERVGVSDYRFRVSNTKFWVPSARIEVGSLKQEKCHWMIGVGGR